MVKKIKKYLKFVVCCALILSLVAPSYAALSASDGSAFVTKAEFDSALADFNARLTTFEAGINSKIDSQVSTYLDRNGIWNGASQDLIICTYDWSSETTNNQWNKNTQIGHTEAEPSSKFFFGTNTNLGAKISGPGSGFYKLDGNPLAAVDVYENTLGGRTTWWIASTNITKSGLLYLKGMLWFDGLTSDRLSQQEQWLYYQMTLNTSHWYDVIATSYTPSPAERLVADTVVASGGKPVGATARYMQGTVGDSVYLGGFSDLVTERFAFGFGDNTLFRNAKLFTSFFFISKGDWLIWNSGYGFFNLLPHTVQQKNYNMQWAFVGSASLSCIVY